MSKAKELQSKYKTLLGKHEINTSNRMAMFFAQLDHESKLSPISENLNYSKEGLLKIFPKYFNDSSATNYARKPEKIANRVYANRMGNSTEESGDGWKYRGRGYIQLTGKSNYEALAKDKGIDCVNSPDLLLEEVNALISALWFWSKNNLNSYADKKDVLGATKRINGGTHGLAERQKKFDSYLKEFN